MAIDLTVSETINGLAVADTLEGGGVGSDLGVVTNSGYAPRINKSQNTGRLDLFIRHNGVNEITDFQTFIQEYGTDSSFAYGGGSTAADDFTSLKNLGAASGASRNNIDGLSGGLWVDMNANVAEVNQFDYATNGYNTVDGSQGGDSSVRIYGDNNLDGLDVESGFEAIAKSMVIASNQSNGGDAGNGFIPNGPVAGTIGAAGNTTFDDNCHLKLRIYLTETFSTGGLHQ